MGKYNPAPYQLDLNAVPKIITDTLPGPKSAALHSRATKHYRGLSGQVKLFPVAFEKGQGCMLQDVDGNQYIDFSSGIYVTTLGHCHPKISEAVGKYANQLMPADGVISAHSPAYINLPLMSLLTMRGCSLILFSRMIAP